MSAKIILSDRELAIVQNKEWLLTKRKIIEKVYELFGGLHSAYQQIAKPYAGQLSYLPISKMGKISRGENYKGLPYLILDYPADFNKKKITAIRTLFWWGNFFSISLHLSGLKDHKNEIERWLNYFDEKGFFISVSHDQWTHEFGAQNFQPFQKHKKEDFLKIQEHDFFRVANRVPLDQWEHAPEKLEASFQIIIEFLKDQLPRR